MVSVNTRSELYLTVFWVMFLSPPYSKFQVSNFGNLDLLGLSNRFSVISFRALREGLLHLFFPAGQVQVLPAG